MEALYRQALLEPRPLTRRPEQAKDVIGKMDVQQPGFTNEGFY